MIKRIILGITFLSLFWGCGSLGNTIQGGAAFELWQQANQNLADHRYNQALFDFQKYIELYPDVERAGDAKYKAVYTKVILGKYDEALNDLNTFLDENPSSKWSFSAEVWRDALKAINNVAPEIKTKKIYIEKEDSELEDLLKSCQDENSGLRERIGKLEHLLEGEH